MKERYHVIIMSYLPYTIPQKLRRKVSSGLTWRQVEVYLRGKGADPHPKGQTQPVFFCPGGVLDLVTYLFLLIHIGRERAHLSRLARPQSIQYIARIAMSGRFLSR